MTGSARGRTSPERCWFPGRTPTLLTDDKAPFDTEAGEFMFGTRFTQSGTPFDAEMHDATYDEVAIFERVLSDAEIRNLALSSGTPSRAVTVEPVGSGSGSVTGPGIDCPGDCTEPYPYGSPVTLNASGIDGSTFAGWSGHCSGTDSCELTIDADRAVSASFTAAR